MDRVHRLLDRVCRLLDDLHPTHTAFAERQGRHQRVATIALLSWPRLKGQKEWGSRWGGGLGGMVGRVGGGQGRVAGRVGWRAGSGGGPGQVAGRVIRG